MTVDEQLACSRKAAWTSSASRELQRKLERSRGAGPPLIVKVGFDPTAPDMHLGHTVLHAQDEALPGSRAPRDLSGRRLHGADRRSDRPIEDRPPLTREEIAAERRDLQAQVFKSSIARRRRSASTASGSSRSERRDGQARRAATTSRGCSSARFQEALRGGQPISMHEFLYPLAQAYDSVFFKADVELGGTDQLFNLNVGRDIMPAYGLEPQVVMTTPLLEGLDGVEKMSKCLGNYVGVTKRPTDVRQAHVDLRRAHVALLPAAHRLGARGVCSPGGRRWRAGSCTRSRPSSSWRPGIVEQFHGIRRRRAQAAAEFERRFSKREAPEDVAGAGRCGRGTTVEHTVVAARPCPSPASDAHQEGAARGRPAGRSEV